MVALPVVSKGVRLDIHMSMAEDTNLQIREFFQYAGTLSTADAQTWLTNIRTAFNTNVMSILSNTLSTTLFELTDLSSSSAPQVVDTTGVSGTSGSAPVPVGVALVIRKHILRRYRGGHPRLYLPGVVASALTNPGAWNPTALATTVADYSAFIAAAVANTNPAAIGAITHVNISYFQGFTNHTFPSGRVKAIPTPRATPLIDTIVSLSGNPVPGSQRRRNEQP